MSQNVAWIVVGGFVVQLNVICDDKTSRFFAKIAKNIATNLKLEKKNNLVNLIYALKILNLGFFYKTYYLIQCLIL